MIDSQHVYQLMLSNVAMGVSIGIVILGLGLTHLTVLGAIFEEQDRIWRGMLRATAGVMGVVVAWITIADDWLQLVTEPYRLTQAWDYQRVIFDPVSSDVRRVTIALVLVVSVMFGALFARYVGGYGLQLACIVPAIVGWFALFIFRQRLDMVINTIPGDNSGSLIDVLAFLGFWLLRTGLGIFSIGMTWLFIVLILAPFVTLLLDVLRIRSPRVSSEARPFYAALEATAADYVDIPLVSRWKPIRTR